NNDVASLEWNKNQKLESYRRRTMTKEEIEKARMDMAQEEEYVKEKKQELFQDLQNFINTKQLYLQNLIKEFLKEYNKDNTYAYIFAYDRGLYYYSDTAYNITGDVIAGLNEKYKKGNKE
ncbi:MAG TPA: OmpH family outer membrane protein, partial [Chitinophagaceae bacterium]|nr:OmpH family outer membrane protein [Chitinophagaceae bacterium]